MTTARQSYFSHIEDLDSGILDLGDPFENGRGVARVCRYELFRSPESLLHPDPNQSGAARWRRVLPAPLDVALPQHPLVNMEALSWPVSGQIAGLLRLNFSRALYYDVAFPLARAAGYRETVCIADAASASAYLNHESGRDFRRRLWVHRNLADQLTGDDVSYYDESLETAARRVQAEADGAAVLGPWGNPYRLEGLKLVGMEIMERFPDCMPTLVVHDPMGELTYALTLAAGLYHGFHLERPPYRLILVQFRPYHGLCRRFEGETVDWSDLELRANQAVVKPSSRYVDGLTTGLVDCRGTAITLDAPAPGEDWLSRAVELLARTGFVDDEDTLIAIDAS